MRFALIALIFAGCTHCEPKIEYRAVRDTIRDTVYLDGSYPIGRWGAHRSPKTPLNCMDCR